MTKYWRTVDFRPIAESGWRALLLKHQQGTEAVPLAGWLIQDELMSDGFDGEHTTGERRVVGAIMTDHWEPEPLSSIGGFWLILGPFAPTPSAEEEAAFRKQRES